MLNEAGLKAAVEANAERLGRPVWEEDFPPIRAAITAYLASVQGEPVAMAWPRGTRVRVEHDGFEGVVLGPYTTLEGKRGQVCQLAGARVVHVYGEKWLMHADDALAETHPADRDGVEAGGWRTMDTAPRGHPTEDAGCRGSSGWFLGRPSKEFARFAAPFVVIRRRAWPQDDSWECNGEAHYVPRYFDAWAPLADRDLPTPPASALKGGA